MKPGENDPWSGDDVPVAPGLGEIVWDTPSARAAAEGIDAETVTGPDRSTRQRLLVPAVAVAAAGTILLAVFAWPDRPQPAAEDPASSTPAPPTTLDTLPPATTSTPPSTVALSTTVAESASDSPEVEAAIVTQLPAGDLPPALADAELITEVVTVTDDGELVTLSLPSGIVTERVDLDLARASRFDLGSNILVVSPNAAMFASQDVIVIVPRGGTAQAIDPDEFGGETLSSPPLPFGWTNDVNGAVVFVVISFDEVGLQSEWLVNTSGEVSPAPAQRAGSFARPIFSLGTRFIDDAGGAYRVDPNGDSTRISNGEILALSETRVLLRECDANRVCTAVLRDYNGEEVRVVDLPPSFRPRFLAASLSPDGSAVTFADPNFAGERTLTDFDSGDTHHFTQQGPELPPPTWSADGSGIFTFGPEGGIRFLDRSTGDEFAFANHLGQIRAIATRLSTD